MREDLADAYGAIDWAVAHLPILQEGFDRWMSGPPYVLDIELNPTQAKQYFKLHTNIRMPATLNAGVGAIVNSLRSSLDLLAASLASRNHRSPNADRHFPIYPSHQEFIDPLNVKKRREWLSEIDRQKIEALKPYEGGNDELFALHRLDITRKHERLIFVDLSPTSFTPPSEYWEKGFGFPAVWNGFYDGAIIGWANIGATDCEPQITTEVTFNERGTLRGRPVLPTLRQFAGLANSIVQQFE